MHVYLDSYSGFLQLPSEIPTITLFFLSVLSYLVAQLWKTFSEMTSKTLRQLLLSLHFIQLWENIHISCTFYSAQNGDLFSTSVKLISSFQGTSLNKALLWHSQSEGIGSESLPPVKGFEYLRVMLTVQWKREFDRCIGASSEVMQLHGSAEVSAEMNRKVKLSI